jgi:nicotinate-nucleotide adenylyltransferase
MARSGQADISPWGDRRRLAAGLLGGSFNPAHQGHLHAGLSALTRLGLDQVWLLVSPQNPLKSRQEMAPLAARLASARAISASHPRLAATAIETALGTRYTADTIAVLKRRFPRIRFVWLMGADNLIQIPRWGHWLDIFRALPIAVVDRPMYSRAALSAKAPKRFAHARVPPRRLAGSAAPAWTFLHIRRHPASASSIRAQAGLSLFPSQSPKESTINQITSQSQTAEAEASMPLESSGKAAVADALDLITRTLDDHKAENIVVIDLRGRTSLCDYMVVATGQSQRQVGAMAEHVVERLKSMGVRSSTEGLEGCDWVLIDGGDIIVHLFRPEVRTFYNLEKMWTPAVQTGE